MKFEMKKQHWVVMAVVLVVSAAARIIPHPMNFAPLAGAALLGAAYIKDSWKAWLLPVGAFWVSDLILNNVVYSSYFEGFVWASTPFLFSATAILGIVLIGRLLLKKVSVVRLIGASISASVIFYLVSNFGVWISGVMYPKDMTGLMEAYVAGLPFLKGTVIGDLVWTGVLFGAWSLIFQSRKSPKLQTEKVQS